MENLLDWKPLKDPHTEKVTKYYPLYWGKDTNMGSRIHAHTSTHIGTWSLQLNKVTSLQNKKIIYGAVPCKDSKNIEDCLQEEYPHIMKTTMGKKPEEKGEKV